MLPIQPPFIPLFFTGKKTEKMPFHEGFFLSWEDALWQLLKIHQIPKGSRVLVPSFFCWDVVKNMEAHGLQQLVYEVDKYLQPNETDFKTKLRTPKLAVVIVFNAVGITNPLFKNPRWLDTLPKETLLIEDCVHCVIDPDKINFITPNHYLIDSLRKVVPIQGSRVFSLREITEPKLIDNLSTICYRIQVLFWWSIMQLSLLFVYLSKNNLAQQIGNSLAEHTMKIGYDIIGDHNNPSPAPKIMHFLANRLNLKSIKQTKKMQTELYLNLLSKIFNQPGFYKIPFSDSDKKELRGFPLGIELSIAASFLAYVRSKNLLVRFELNDSPWALKQKIVYLPMGQHVSSNEIKKVCKIIANF